MEQQVNYTTIIALLRALQTDQVNKAQQQLMQIAKKSQFMEVIFTIIKSQTEDEWIKTLASTFLNRVLCDYMTQISEISLFTGITNILSSYQIKPLDKRCFERSIISAMELMQQNNQQKWKQFIWKTLKDPQLLDTAFLLIACLGIAQIPSKYLSQLILQMLDYSFKVIGQIVVQHAVIINQLIKTWIVVWDRLLVLKKDQKKQQIDQITPIMNQIVKSQYIAHFINNIYMLKCAKPSQLLICVEPGLQQLNLLKYEAAQLNRRIAMYSFQISFQSAFIIIIKNNFYAIRNTLGAIGMELQNNALQKFQCQDFIICLMSLTIIYVKFYKSMVQISEVTIIQHIVCFQFLITREDQMITFQESPVDFNSLIEDCCDKQTFGILKTQAAKLLQTLGDIFPQTTQSALKMCIQSIKIKLGFSQNVLLNSPVKILDLQVAFQVLSIFSYTLQNYPDQLSDLRIILLDKRTALVNPFQMTKIFLFLGYNYNQVFPKLEQGAIWVQIALNCHVHPTTRYFGLDFIANIADEFYSNQLLFQIGKLIKSPKVGETGQVWSMINKLIDHQKNKISEQQLIHVVNIIYDRIQSELKLLQLGQKQTTLDIINALHVLRKIIQDREYCKNKTILKERIFNVTAMYPQAVKLNIQDEIVKIINQFLKENTFPESIFSILPILIKQFGIDGYCDQSYLVCFNQIIIKSSLIRIKDIQRLLLTALIFHLNDMSKEAKKTKQKRSIGNVLVLLENLISVHGYEIANNDQNYLFQIGSMCIRLFPQQEQKIFSKGLLARGLNLLLLCHLYIKFDDTFNYLIKYAQNDIFYGYDALVLMNLLSRAIIAQDNVDIVIQLLNLMVNIWNANKDDEQNKKNPKTKKVTKKKMLIKRDEDFDKILQKISNPFTTIRPTSSGKENVYLTPLKDTIKSTLYEMKSSNIDTYQLIMLNLSEEMRTKLNFLLTNVELEGGKARVIRKVVGLKNSEDNTNITQGKKQKQSKQKNQMNNENVDEQAMQQDDQEVNQFKRRRILKKKQKNKKFRHQE